MMTALFIIDYNNAINYLSFPQVQRSIGEDDVLGFYLARNLKQLNTSKTRRVRIKCGEMVSIDL